MAPLLGRRQCQLHTVAVICLLVRCVPGADALVEARDKGIATRIPCAFSVSDVTETECNTTLRQIFRVLSVGDDSILLGSAECLYLLDTNLTVTSSVQLSGPLGCDYDDFTCKNYLTTGSELDATTFHVCGTYDAYNPQCWTCHKTQNALTCEDQVDNDVMPRTTNQNFTSILVDDIDFVGRVIPLPIGDKNTFSKHDASGQEVDTDDSWISGPVDFVGEPISYGEFIYFFFRERAQENTIEPAIYSRVARVCKNDAGGITNPLRNTFTTFLKARLECSNGDQFPTFYNEIQDVKQSSIDAGTIYGLFTTPNAGQVSSAICRYSLRELDKLFNQDYRRGPTSDNYYPDPTKRWNWIPINSQDGLNKRDCTTAYPFGNVYTYIESFPLINTNAKNCGLGQTCDDYSRSTDDPLAVFPGVHGSQLEVYNDSDTYLMVAIGTNDRSILIADINTREAVIRDTLTVCSKDLGNPEEVEKKWPYGVSYLHIHQTSLYGAVDNCAFKYSLVGDRGDAPVLSNILDRSEPQNYTYAQNLSDSVTRIFKLFEASPGVQMVANFTGELADPNCSQTRFETDGSEFLHVHCELRNITVDPATQDVVEGEITVTSQSGLADPLTVKVTINIDPSLQNANEELADDTRRHDRELASYKYMLEQWLQRNVTCGESIDQCKSATTCKIP